MVVSVWKQTEKIAQTWASSASGLHSPPEFFTCETRSSNADTASSISRQAQLSTEIWASWSNSSTHNNGASPVRVGKLLNMRISYRPIPATETDLGEELLPGRDERAMKACAIRSLPDVGLDIAHIGRPRNDVRRTFRRSKHRVPPASFETQDAAALFAQPKTGHLEAAIQI
jgi:hypothetical protein